MDYHGTTDAQFKAARAMLGMLQEDLAEAADVSITMVRLIEQGKAVSLKEKTARKLRKALEARGVVFLSPGETSNGGEGVRLADKSPPG